MGCGRQVECAKRYPALRICPDCGCDLGFPIVRQAGESADALLQRYDNAKSNCLVNIEKIQEFEATVEQRSNVILAVPYKVLLTILNSGNALYANYYYLIDGKVRLAAQVTDHQRRIETDNRLFGAYKEELTFCALSLSHAGVWSYGPYHLTLNINMIANRVTFTEKNTFRHQEWCDEITLSDGYKTWQERPGFRADWSTKAKLAAAKLASKLKGETRREQFGALLLQSDGVRDGEDYIEGHVYGSFTRQAISHVRAPADNEFGTLVRNTPISQLRRERKDVAAKVSALKAREGIAIDFKCGD